jgi:hypothetical protein
MMFAHKLVSDAIFNDAVALCQAETRNDYAGFFVEETALAQVAQVRIVFEGSAFGTAGPADGAGVSAPSMSNLII